ncbi:FAD/NAD(P)-binding domain-containing protein [Penicillium angulare]|uniref:FAD/NAD(P)-binding domain-containing protein n=1 Tax=Penicillium angulare TaxID=116970 RepID=A0A9W9K5W7_9EURO|nr:FAD/NAD(P)-binding domain-containing protein [Penicillium angulare]
MSSPPKVLIIGCGVAGPVLSLLLKNKGYQPVIYEKVKMLGEAGGSLMLNPNGMKVLNMVRKIDDLLEGTATLPLSDFWHGTNTGETLAHNSLGTEFVAKYSQPSMGIKRTTLNLQLKKMLLDRGSELHEGYELINIEEDTDCVTAHFSNGQSATGAFLVGCDGIKAASRRIFLEKAGTNEGAPSFTGLTQTGGISKTPKALAEKPGTLHNWYGAGVHVVAYPISTTHTSWAVTLPQASEQPETWALASGEELADRQKMLLAKLEGFEPVVLELVKAVERIISFGLFDRVTLDREGWFSKRCVLVGDAAHPTSPHLGQGANQALEDCYHLSRLLPQVKDDAKFDEYVDLSKIFDEFAGIRQPRTSALVKGARKMGEERVVTGGPELCRQRDAQIAARFGDLETLKKSFDGLYSEPF